MISSPLARRTVAFALFAAAALAFLATLVRSDDPDMFHHLALGREILRSGLPAQEPFLYPLRGETTGPAPYWLGSVSIYAAWALFGETGLSLLPAVLGGLIAVVLLLDAAPRAGKHTLLSLAAAALPVALALETYRYRAVARTEIFSALLLALTMWGIRRFEDGRPTLLLAFPAYALIWTNLHPGTAVGLVPLAALLASGSVPLLLARATGRRVSGALSPRHLATALALLAAAVVTSAVNPSPNNPVVTAVRFAAAALGLDAGAVAAGDTAVSNVLVSAGELRGGGGALWGTPVGILIIVTAVSFAFRPREARLREVATFAMFAVLPFLAVRFAMFSAIVAAPFAARNLAASVYSLPSTMGRIPVQGGAAAIFALASVATAPLGALAPHIRFGAGVARGVFPVRAADYLQSIGFEGRLFNTFHLGGYLAWREVGPPFQDGRGTTRPEDAAAAMVGPMHYSLFATLDARYRFDALVVSYPGLDPSSNPLAPIGLFDPDRANWALVAFDDGGLLYLRRRGAYADLARRDAYHAISPAAPMLPAALPNPVPLLDEYRRSVRESPDCFRCRYFLGEVALAAGRPEEAAAAVAPAIPRAYGTDRAVLQSIADRARALLPAVASPR